MNDSSPAHRGLSGGLKLTALLLAGATLASGRYDWVPNPDLALRSWTMSYFFFALITIGLYALVRAFSPHPFRGFWVLLTILTAVLNLPYRWLGLAKYFYLSKYPLVYHLTAEWLPEWLFRNRPTIPWNATDRLYVIVFGLTALLAMVTVVYGWRRRREAVVSAPAAFSLVPYGFFFLVFGCLTLESWMHLSNRSPYSYIPHFEQPAAANHLYNYEMLPDGRGRVNADFGYFVRLEELFVGNAIEPPMLLIRRAFPFYVSSHLSYFLGAYHALLILNLLLWMAAVVAIYHFCRDLTQSNVAAGSAAGFVACAPGFIMYATQPMSYLPGYAMLAIMIFIYHRLVTKARLGGPAAILSAGILLGLTMLTYDTFAWVLFLVGYALVNRVAVLRAVAAIAVGAAIYVGFLVLLYQVFKLQPERDNDRHMGDAIRQTYEFFRHPQLAQIIPLTKSYVTDYCSQVLQINFYVPVVLAIAGLFVATNRVRICALMLLLPSLATFFILHFGGSYLASLARFNYACYPAVILLAAVAVGRVADYWRAAGRQKVAWVAWMVPVLAAVAIGNIDAFGLLPQLYFHFYWHHGGYFN